MQNEIQAKYPKSIQTGWRLIPLKNSKEGEVIIYHAQMKMRWRLRVKWSKKYGVTITATNEADEIKLARLLRPLNDLFVEQMIVYEKRPTPPLRLV